MKSWLLGGAIAVFVCGSLVGLAQEDPKPAKATAEVKADAPKGRLQSHFGKLGLTDQQKAKIYASNSRFEEQIDELEQKIADLKIKRDQDAEALLTDAQKKLLKSLIEAAKEARAKGKSGSEEAKTDATPAKEEKK